MTNQPIKISDNCWKHTDKSGNVFYTKTFDPDSQLHREDGPAVEWFDGAKDWYHNDKLIDVNSQKEFEIYIKNLMFK